MRQRRFVASVAGPRRQFVRVVRRSVAQKERGILTGGINTEDGAVRLAWLALSVRTRAIAAGQWDPKAPLSPEEAIGLLRLLQAVAKVKPRTFVSVQDLTYWRRRFAFQGLTTARVPQGRRRRIPGRRSR